MRDREQCIAAAAPFCALPPGPAPFDVPPEGEPHPAARLVEAAVLVPPPPDGADEGDGLRQTYLVHLPRAADRALLCRLARRLYHLTQEDEGKGGAGREPFHRRQLRAAGRDLRYTAWVLEVVAASCRTPGDPAGEDRRLVETCQGLARVVERLAGRIAAEVGR